MTRRPMMVAASLPAVEMLEARALFSVAYTITDLGPGAAYDINASGQVVVLTASRVSVYSNGTMTELGSVPGSSSEFPWGINSSGQVVGSSHVGNEAHAFLYSDGKMVDLGMLPGDRHCEARGINDSGQVVGSSASSDGKQRAFLYSDGVMTDLGTFGGAEGAALSINNKGQIAGCFTDAMYNFHACVYDGGKTTDLGTLGGTESVAFHINEAGQVVGYAEKPTYPGYDAFYWSAGKMTDLGVLPGYTRESWALCINDRGDIVGWSRPDNYDYHAFVYTNGTMIDLNDLVSGWTLQQATAINNSGQIVGYGINPSGSSEAFLLTPVRQAPTSLALLFRRIAENMPAGTVVGSLSTADPDAGDTFAYTLVGGGVDNAAFKITADGRLKTRRSFDFETKSSYRIRVRSTDQSGLFCEKAITIKVSDVNEAPTDVVLSNSMVREHRLVFSLVGQLIGSDPDAGKTLTYALVGGAGSRDNGRFWILGGTLRTASVFDYATKNVYRIRVRVTDQDGLWYEKAMVVGVTHT